MAYTWETLGRERWRRWPLEWTRNCSDPCCSWSQCRRDNLRRMLWMLSLWSLLLITEWQIAESRLCVLQMDGSQLQNWRNYQLVYITTCFSRVLATHSFLNIVFSICWNPYEFHWIGLIPYEMEHIFKVVKLINFNQNK